MLSWIRSKVLSLTQRILGVGLEDRKTGGQEDWRTGGLENRRAGGLENWSTGGLDDKRTGGLEDKRPMSTSLAGCQALSTPAIPATQAKDIIRASTGEQAQARHPHLGLVVYNSLSYSAR